MVAVENERVRRSAIGRAEAEPEAHLRSATRPLCTVNNRPAFADQTAPPVLLVIGPGGQLIHWDDAFLRLLADLGRYLIRLENVDVRLALFQLISVCASYPTLLW
jgi:hypothetical protein